MAEIYQVTTNQKKKKDDDARRDLEKNAPAAANKLGEKMERDIDSLYYVGEIEAILFQVYMCACRGRAS